MTDPIRDVFHRFESFFTAFYRVQSFAALTHGQREEIAGWVNEQQRCWPKCHHPKVGSNIYQWITKKGHTIQACVLCRRIARRDTERRQAIAPDAPISEVTKFRLAGLYGDIMNAHTRGDHGAFRETLRAALYQAVEIGRKDRRPATKKKAA